MQFVTASAEYVPTAHATHAVDAFASRSAVPARHGMQLVWASDTAARPAAHATHAVAADDAPLTRERTFATPSTLLARPAWDPDLSAASRIAARAAKWEEFLGAT